MLSIDFIGLFFTYLLVGVRYPHYVIISAVIHEFGRVMMALFLHGKIDVILAAGAFGSTTINNYNDDMTSILIILSGPLANYIIGASAGIQKNRISDIINPSAVVTSPFAVINFRLALVSILVSLWQYL